MSNFSGLRKRAGLSVSQTAEKTGYDVRTIYRWERGENPPRRAVVEVLESLASCNDKSQQHAFTFIDLFAGIGGLRRGFDSIGGKCVFTSEWDRFAQETYRENYECDHDIAGDITKIPADDIPAHDVLLAGFPCQPFSIAGVSKKNSLGRKHGFHDEAQGTLFFDVARIIEHHQPKAFLLENVKNLVNHDKGRTFQIIHETLKDELGYQVKKLVINAKSWTPQNRERIFIVGFREKNSFTFNGMDIPDLLNGPRLETILHPEDGTEKAEKHFTCGTRATVHEKYTLSDKLWTYLQGYAEKHRKKGNGFGYGLFGPEGVARTLSARYYKDGSEILIRQDGKAPRRLTPRECARLMGFDRPGKSGFKIPVSDTQAYKQFGNAVVVPVVDAVAQHMKPWLYESLKVDTKSAQEELSAVA